MKSFSAAPSLSAPLEQYLAHLNKQRRISNSSLINYRSDLLLFRDFIADYRISQWSDITDRQAQAFIEEAQTRQLSTATARRRLSALQGFFNYLRRAGVITRDPLLGFTVTVGTVLTQPVKEPINSRLLHSFTADGFVSQRDKTIVELLLCCPLTLAELLTLELFSIDIAQGLLQLRRENEGEVSFALTEAAMNSVKDWMELRMAVVTFEQSLFVTEKGQCISLRTVQLGISRVAKSLGMKRLSARDLQGLQREEMAQKIISDKPEITVSSRRMSQLVQAYQKVKKDREDD